MANAAANPLTSPLESGPFWKLFLVACAWDLPFSFAADYYPTKRLHRVDVIGLTGTAMGMSFVYAARATALGLCGVRWREMPPRLCGHSVQSGQQSGRRSILRHQVPVVNWPLGT